VEYNNELIAGGYFGWSGNVACNYIAAWNGDTWHPLGPGMNDHVWSLAVYGGDLVAGGYFTEAGGQSCTYVARWTPVTAACCLASGSCQMLSTSDCAAAGGSPGGNGSNCASSQCQPCVGDLNCDGLINFGDINPFVQYLSSFATWQSTYAACPALNGDINCDGTYGQNAFGDINPFVALLVQCGLGCPCPGPISCP